MLGCASSGRVVPTNELMPILSTPDTTLLLFAIDSRDRIKTIHISGKNNVVLSYSPYQFIELEAGSYQITKLTFDYGYIDLKDLDDSEIWQFNVKPGAINYVGHFHLKEHDEDRYSFSLDNKSTSALKYLEKNYPSILQNKKLVYGGLDRDDFFQFVSELAGKTND
jgi:hypothetical protein